MSKSGITLSKEHGLNPSIDHCFICGAELGIILFGTKYKDENGKTAEAPMNCCTGTLCDNCKNLLKDNVAIIEVKSEQDSTRTGRYSYVPKDAITVDIPKGIAYMASDEFNQMFNQSN